MSILAEIPPGPPLAELLALEQVAEGHYRSVGKDRNLNGEVFGGQYLALAVKAAMLSAGGRAPHAMHAFFLRGASADRPVDFHAEQTREGRAFAHRRITASQDAREVFRAEISLHDWEDGHPEHGAAPPRVVPPEGLQSAHQFIRDHLDELNPVGVRRALGRTSFDSAYQDPAYTFLKSPDRTGFDAWVWPKDPPEADDRVGYFATIAYLTDAFGNFACRASHAPNCYDGSTGSTSLNHAVWFHGRPRPLDYLLFSMDSPFSGGGLGLNRGTIFDRQGNILASMVQEALIRYPQPQQGTDA
jgi:acyl-CoA thioesterase-2